MISLDGTSSQNYKVSFHRKTTLMNISTYFGLLIHCKEHRFMLVYILPNNFDNELSSYFCRVFLIYLFFSRTLQSISFINFHLTLLWGNFLFECTNFNRETKFISSPFVPGCTIWWNPRWIFFIHLNIKKLI